MASHKEIAAIKSYIVNAPKSKFDTDAAAVALGMQIMFYLIAQSEEFETSVRINLQGNTKTKERLDGACNFMTRVGKFNHGLNAMLRAAGTNRRFEGISVERGQYIFSFKPFDVSPFEVDNIPRVNFDELTTIVLPTTGLNPVTEQERVTVAQV